jgi:hypothetical protein
MTPSNVPEIAQIIQLSVAPVFLLVGIGGLLNVITSRLARIVDRVRALEEDVPNADEPRRRDELGELAVLARRMKICQLAIASCTFSAMLVCVTVMVLFIAGIRALDFEVLVAFLFVAVMAALTLGLGLFLWEVRISTRVVRVRDEYVQAGRKVREG